MILNNLDTANEQHQMIPKGNFQSTVTKAEEKKAVVMAKVCGGINNKQKAIKITVVMVYYYNILLCRPCVQE